MKNPTIDEVLARMYDYLHENVERSLPASLSASTRLVADLCFDSLEGAQMLADLEDHYEVTIAVSALQRAETLGDLATVVVSAIEARKRP